MSALTTVKKFFPNVEFVVDSTRNAKIEVTDKDASSKAIKNHNACAMAVACKRKFHLDGVIISRTTAYLIKGKRARRFKIPVSVAREVVSFDRGAGFAPGNYELSSIPKSGRLGTKISSNKGKHNKNVQPKFRHLTSNVRAVLGGQKAL